MAMTVMNNSSAQMALGELRKNDSSLSKQLKKVSSGMKINGAGDGASDYSISERMRTMIRSLHQNDDNTKTGSSMAKVASEAIDNQVQLLKQLRSNALKASDDTYSQKDRDTLQLESDQIMDELDSIGQETNYNGKLLLNGVSGAPPKLVFDVGNPQANSVAIIQDTATVAGTKATSGYPFNLPSSNLDQYDNVAGSQLYDPNNPTMTAKSSLSGLTTGSLFYDSSGQLYTGTMRNNVLMVQTGTSGGTATYATVVDSGGKDSQGGFPSGPTVMAYDKKCALIQNPSAGMTVSDRLDGSNSGVYATEPGSGDPIIKRWSGTSNSYPFDLSSFSGAIPKDLDQEGISMLCTACNQFVSIIFDANATAGSLNEVNSKQSGAATVALVIGLNGTTTADDVLDAIWTGVSSKHPVSKLSNGGDTISLPGNHPLNLNRYPKAGGGWSYSLARFNSSSQSAGQPSSGSHLVIYDGIAGKVKDEAGKVPYKYLTIQDGTTGSQDTKLKFPNMTLGALFPAGNTIFSLEPKDQDYPEVYPKEYDGLPEAAKKLKWRDEIWPYTKAGASTDASALRTREGAQRFLDDIDQALKYALDSATTMGAEMQRLEVMNKNIVTKHENTQASESTIRDADMAKEMTGFVKANVLSQASQAMLAQANQNGSNVLSLLQG